MAVKKVNFEGYSNKELFRIKKDLDGNLANLPEEIQNYIKTENPVSGNVMTRIGRCHSLINVIIVERFMCGLIK